MRSVRIYININYRVLAIIGDINIKANILLMLISLLSLTSCYASGNLGVVQKINSADMIVEGIGNVIRNATD